MPATWSPMTMDATTTQLRQANRSQRPRKVVDGGEGRGLIRMTPRLCSLVPSVTTPLYRTTVSKALRLTLRGGVPRRKVYALTDYPRGHGGGTEDVEARVSRIVPMQWISHQRQAHNTSRDHQEEGGPRKEREERRWDTLHSLQQHSGLIRTFG